jgi:hypothetical protein
MARWTVGAGGRKGISCVNASVLASWQNFASDSKGDLSSNGCNCRDVLGLAKD